jgi:hypothetical protein
MNQRSRSPQALPSRRRFLALLSTLGLLTAFVGAGAAAASATPSAAPASPATSTGSPPTPPPVDVLQHTGALAPGDVFITPTATGTAPAYANGPEILNNDGQPVWFLPLASGQAASDFRVQSYQGQPVLTWWEGTPLSLAGPGPGTDYIANDHYQVIATVNAGNGQNANGHEFQLTPWGTALITIYKQATADLTSVGGPKDGQVLEGVVQEIDIQTGKVLFEWDSLDHVPVNQSYAALPTNPSEPWDYFHINAVHLAADGNLLISARHTWTIYKVNIHTGATIWQLGGKASTLKLGPGVQFAWQHDPTVVSATQRPGFGWQGGGGGAQETLRIFDNESNGTAVLPYSRIITIQVNTANDTATLVSSFKHPDGLSAPSQGDAQTLPNGDIFVGWGQLGRYSEFDPNGNLLYDVTLPSGYDTYRAYRDIWNGSPSAPPTALATAGGSGGESVQAVWNGATQVAYWQVLGGSSSTNLQPVGSTAWEGLDTTISLATQPQYVQVVAYNAAGQPIGSSATVAAGSA